MNIETVKKVMSGVVSTAIEQAEEDLGELLEAEAEEERAAVISFLRRESSLAWICDKPEAQKLIDELTERIERGEHTR